MPDLGEIIRRVVRATVLHNIRNKFDHLLCLEEFSLPFTKFRVEIFSTPQISWVKSP